MSSSTPGPADRPAHDPDVEYLGDAPRPGSGSRRTGLVVAGTAVVVGAAAAGAWAVAQFVSGGPAPAGAVPSDAFAYVALDLDPDGGQKVEALQTLRKFPALREELDIDSGSDLRRVVYDALTAERPCPDIDFDEDIDPWLGGKIAAAAVPGDEEPTPFLVVQVEDEALAEKAVEEIAACAEEDAPGTAFTGDYMVMAKTGELAEEVAAAAEEGSLADDEAFGRWIDEAGGSGIVEGYLSADAPEQLPEGQAFAGFEGAALVVRFDDEALEMELAAGGLPGQTETGGESGIEDLPATTALALGFGVTDTAVQEAIDGLTESAGLTEDDVQRMLTDAEAATGLRLPEDAQTLLGDGLSVAVDSSADFDALVNSSEPPTGMPAGVRIVGDPAEITPLLDTLLTRTGVDAQGVVVEAGDGVVAIGLDEAYVAQLAEDGALGEEDRFRSALPESDPRAGALFMDFDAGDWLTELAATDPDERIEANVAPLDSLGIGGWVEGEVAHGMVKLTTD